MTRVRLEILWGRYRPAMDRGIPIESCRLVADVSLWGSSGWASSCPAVVDTGAPVSLFPRGVWEAADVHSLGSVRVGGIARKPECKFDATLATITLAIRDRTTQIAPIEVHALLADTDDVPTLIGMRGILTDLILHANIARSEAYLELSS